MNSTLKLWTQLGLGTALAGGLLAACGGEAGGEGAAGAQEAAIYSGMDRVHPVWAENGMVSAQERVAAEVGRDILAQGGNAVDAGVAVDRKGQHGATRQRQPRDPGRIEVEQLRRHLADFVSAYNFGRRLKTLKGLTPYEFICKRWIIEPERFIVNPIHQMPGLNT